MENWSDWIDPVLSFIEIVLLLATIAMTASQFTRSRASSYIERFNSSDALGNRTAVDRWLEAHRTTKERLQALDGDPALRNHLRQFANLFQELGAAYQFGVAHRKSVRVLFDALVIMYWEQLRFWIYHYRAQSDPTLYARFEYLYDELSRQRGDAPDTPVYVVAYGSLMDPASLGAALGRDVVADELIPIVLRDIARTWSLGESVLLEGSEAPVTAAFLDVEDCPGERSVATLAKITEKELGRLRRREKNYAERDIATQIELIDGHSLSGGVKALCFFGRAEHAIGSPQGAVILERYLNKVCAAAAPIESGLADEIRALAVKSQSPTVAGPYAFADSVQSRLV